MATKVYLTNTASDLDIGAQEDLLGDVGVKGGGLSTGSTDTATTAIPLTRDTAADVPVWWWTAPIDAVTISGTVTFNVWMAESNMSANVSAKVRILRADGAGSLISDLFSGNGSDKGTEVPVTTRAAQNWTAVPTSTAFSAGDRIAIGLYQGAALSPSAGFTCSASWAGTSDAADGDTWVQFTETITEQVAAAANPPRRNPMIQLLAH